MSPFPDGIRMKAGGEASAAVKALPDAILVKNDPVAEGGGSEGDPAGSKGPCRG